LLPGGNPSTGPQPVVTVMTPLPPLGTPAPAASSAQPQPPVEAQEAALSVVDFCVYYGKKKALHGVTMDIPRGKITAMIGPSGCGKSTLLRSMNRLNDLIPHVRTTGEIRYHGQNIAGREADVTVLRKHIGMVFQKSNPFPKSIFDNVVYSLRISGVRNKAILREVCERSLRDAALWDEVKDNLKGSALSLSGGQQQRLCIARALATQPKVLLMDEPCSALDPVATARIEELIGQLKSQYTIVIVTHNMQQAARVSDWTAFFCLGELIEYDVTRKIFTNPGRKQTEDYITGRFG
jgi:phosphate transport system ATP-binding protein